MLIYYSGSLIAIYNSFSFNRYPACIAVRRGLKKRLKRNTLLMF